MLKCSTEVRGTTDPGDSDISGFSTAIKRRIGGHFHLFQLREFKGRKRRINVLGISFVGKIDQSSGYYQARLLVKGQMREKVKKKIRPSISNGTLE